MKLKLCSKKGITLVEVICVLVILGILAAVAVPKFFDMQEKARVKSFTGCIAILNGEASAAFANNILIKGKIDGKYDGYVGSGDPDLLITGQAADTPATGTIKLKSHPDTYELIVLESASLSIADTLILTIMQKGKNRLIRSPP